MPQILRMGPCFAPRLKGWARGTAGAHQIPTHAYAASVRVHPPPLPVIRGLRLWSRVGDSISYGTYVFYSLAHVKHPPVQPRSANMVYCAVKSTSASGLQDGCSQK